MRLEVKPPVYAPVARLLRRECPDTLHAPVFELEWVFVEQLLGLLYAYGDAVHLEVFAFYLLVSLCEHFPNHPNSKDGDIAAEAVYTTSVGGLSDTFSTPDVGANAEQTGRRWPYLSALWCLAADSSELVDLRSALFQRHLRLELPRESPSYGHRVSLPLQVEYTLATCPILLGPPQSP